MKFSIVVDRMQYGVGQGGFHCQQIAVKTDNSKVQIEPYRFVYDCGSDTGEFKKGQTKPLEWAIRHFAGRMRSNAAKPKLVVNALYLSHFQKDHIDGALRLAQFVDLREIVIPHITAEQFSHIVAQQVSTGDIASMDQKTQRYLQVLQSAASGDGSVIGNVPTTRVPSDGETPDAPSASGNNAPLPTPEGQEPTRGEQDKGPGDLPEGAYEIRDAMRPSGQWQHRISRLLHVGQAGRNAPDMLNFWEMRVWSYAQSLALSNSVVQELGKLEVSPGNPALPRLIAGKVDISEITWAIKNRVKIQNAYKKALKLHKVTAAHDHNVVSLCLHSGPAQMKAFSVCCERWHASFPFEFDSWLLGSSFGWVGTGDALLAGVDAWAGFKRHFSQGHDRLLEWLTVLMPHHGSGSGGNFNAGLLGTGMRFAVFSAGAFNKYGHPSRNVLDTVVDSRARAVVVTEYARPGFFEHLTYSVSPRDWFSL
ncbi:hypothetical protein [Rhodoferax ferrireducens]|uniref:hypothetical protein n=1 Tax=Rhodoferax ferrireducens TaxID=192843 RepID=UPI003BB4CBC0